MTRSFEKKHIKYSFENEGFHLHPVASQCESANSLWSPHTDRALSEPPVGLSGTVWFHSSLLMFRNKVSLCEDWFLCIIIHSLYKHLLPNPHLPLIGHVMCQALTEWNQFIHVWVKAAGPNSGCAAPLGTAGQVQASIAFTLNSAPFISNF